MTTHDTRRVGGATQGTGRARLARAAAAVTVLVAAVGVFGHAVATGESDDPVTRPTAAAPGRHTASVKPAGAPPVAPDRDIPAPTPQQRAVADVSETVIATRSQSRARSAEGYVVLADGQPALDSAIDAAGVTPTDVWDGPVYGFAADLASDQVAMLRTQPGVTSVTRDATLYLTTEQTDPPWGLDRIDQRNLPLDGRFRYPATGAGVTVYIIDSGLWFSHTEFEEDRVANGAYVDFGNEWGPWDCNGHGTHVAGTVAGTTYGVAKQATIVPVKVFDCDGSTTGSAVASGIDWVIDHHRPGDPAVANLSFGGPVGLGAAHVEAFVEALVDDGVTVVVAAGNAAAYTCSYTPARLPDVITVAASDDTDDDARFSNYGPCNDLFAPGVNVLSAVPSETDDESVYMSGTSMAAPHVTGAAALLLETNPSATPAQIWSDLDAATTRGVLSVCCDDPNKLLYVEQTTLAPPTTTPATTSPSTTSPPTSAAPTSAPAPPPGFTSLTPARVLETRVGLSTVDGRFAGGGIRAAGSTVELTVAGRAGVPLDASAVMLNVTAVVPEAAGHFTVFPCGQRRPVASNVNYLAGRVVPNAVLAKVGVDGKVCIYTLAAAHIVVDTNGYA